MGIVASVILADSPQRDGRRQIHELHTDQVGVKYDRFYLAGVNDDVTAALGAYAVVLAANIQQAEIAANVAAVTALGSLASPVLLYSTAAQNFSALRAAYQVATQIQAVMIGDFLNTLTDAQLQAAFSLTALQVTNLRTNKLTPAASIAASVRAAAGQ